MFIEGNIILLFCGAFLAMEIVMLVMASNSPKPTGLSKKSVSEIRRQRSLLIDSL